MPYRKFVASPGWLTAGPLTHRALDDVAHFALDPRVYDAEKEDQRVIFGYFRYGESGVGIAADEAVWLGPLVARWAEGERVNIDYDWSVPIGWNPGA